MGSILRIVFTYELINYNEHYMCMIIYIYSLHAFLVYIFYLRMPNSLLCVQGFSDNSFNVSIKVIISMFAIIVGFIIISVRNAFTVRYR